MERVVASLSGTWQVRPVETFAEAYPEEGWLEAQVPGHWQEVPGLETHAGKVVYRTQFELSPGRDRRYWLRLGGVFYWTAIHLNGSRLGSHEGYFYRQVYEATPHLQTSNRVRVEVDCPDEDPAKPKRMVTGVFSHWDAIDPQSNPGGIWRPVEVLETGKVAITETSFRVRTISPDAAEVSARISLDSAYGGPVRLRIAFVPHNFRGRPEIREEQTVLNPGESELDWTYALEKPRLWWTHDLGDPSLYRVVVEAVMPGGEISDRYEKLFGIRQFELDGWIPVLNGRRLFLKGSNYGPGHARMARMSRGQYRRDLDLAAKAHMNFLRVHSHIEAPEFYDAADESGMLLWQDFPLQWTYSREVLEPALDQVEEMVQLLGCHPSVAIWCMHNEPIAISGTSSLKGKGLRGRWQYLRMLWNLFGYSWNREVLDSRLAARTRKADPTRPVVRSSGEWSLPWRRGTDGHHYHGWYPEAGPLARLDRFLQRFPRNFRFVTEFGSQSFPNLKTSLRFMGESLDELDWNRLEERYQLQGDHLRRWVPVGELPDLETLIAATQAYQARVHRYFIDRLRLRKYRPTGGIANFMFHDPNPAVSWSILDHRRDPKQSYHRLAHAYHPQYVFALIEDGPVAVGQEVEFPIFVVNDSHSDLGPVRISAQVFDSEGRTMLQAGFSAEIPADSTSIEVGRIHTRFRAPGSRRLILRLFHGSDVFENRYSIRVS